MRSIRRPKEMAKLPGVALKSKRRTSPSRSLMRKLRGYPPMTSHHSPSSCADLTLRMWRASPPADLGSARGQRSPRSRCRFPRAVTYELPASLQSILASPELAHQSCGTTARFAFVAVGAVLGEGGCARAFAIQGARCRLLTAGYCRRTPPSAGFRKASLCCRSPTYQTMRLRKLLEPLVPAAPRCWTFTSLSWLRSEVLPLAGRILLVLRGLRRLVGRTVRGFARLTGLAGEWLA